MKRAISQPPVLGMANFSEKFIIQTDASGAALGAGVRQPIAYTSQSLSAQERKASSTYDLECLAVLFGTEKFCKYIEHQDFILETDNKALSSLSSQPRQSGKIGRWVVKISALKFEVRHDRGTQNIVADTHSGMFDSHTSDSANQIESHLVLTEFPLAFQELGQLQQEDPTLAGIMAQLENCGIVYGYSLCKGRYIVAPRNEVTRSSWFQQWRYRWFSPIFMSRSWVGIWGSLRPQTKYVRILFGKVWIRTYVPGFVHVKLVLLVNWHRTPVGGCWPQRSHKGRCRKFSFIIWVNCQKVKPAIRPYSAVLMPSLSSFDWFLLGKRRLE